MAKPILYYVLVRGFYGRGFGVLGVTSEKGRQVYGRTDDDAVTHVSQHDVIFRFPTPTTLEFAQAAGARADAEKKRHEVGISQARAELNRLEDVARQKTLEAAKGVLSETLSPTCGACFRPHVDCPYRETGGVRPTNCRGRS